MIKIQDFSVNFSIFKNKSNDLSKEYLYLRDNLMESSLKRIFQLLENQNKLIISLLDFCNELISIIKTEKKASKNSISNIGFKITNEFKTSNLNNNMSNEHFRNYSNKINKILPSQNKSLDKNISQTLNHSSRNIKKNYLGKSYSSADIIDSKDEKLNSFRIKNKKGTEYYPIKATHLTKELINTQYKIIQKYNNRKNSSKEKKKNHKI
jgi:hypothetical protein